MLRARAELSEGQSAAVLLDARTGAARSLLSQARQLLQRWGAVLLGVGEGTGEGVAGSVSTRGGKALEHGSLPEDVRMGLATELQVSGCDSYV